MGSDGYIGGNLFVERLGPYSLEWCEDDKVYELWAPIGVLVKRFWGVGGYEQALEWFEVNG